MRMIRQDIGFARPEKILASPLIRLSEYFSNIEMNQELAACAVVKPRIQVIESNTRIRTLFTNRDLATADL